MDKPAVLLIQPPIYDFALYDLYLKPYGLLRLGRWFAESGYRVDFVNGLDYMDGETVSRLGKVKRKSDGTGKFHRIPVKTPSGLEGKDRRFARYGMLPEVFRKKIAASSPDLILITSGMTYWYKGVVEAVETVREVHPGVPAAVGGIYATLMPEHCRENTGADFVVEGDGAPALRRILMSLNLPVPEGEPEGVLPVENVWKDAGILRLNTGCPYHCDYCASDIISDSFLPGNAERGYLQMKEMHERFGTENFAFYDDALLINKERTFVPFLRKAVEENTGLNFYLPNAVHLQFLDKDVSVLMKRAGFKDIRLGFESSSADFHSRYDDKYSVSDFARAVENLKSAGFGSRDITVYILAGLPRQDYMEVEDSLRYAAGFNVRVSLAEYSPVPGTPLWEESVRLCPLPLEEEPLYHNNTFFSMEWEGFTRENLAYLKQLAVSFNRDLQD